MGGHVSEATLRAFEDARAAGYAPAVCSGRCWGLVPRELKGNGVMDYYVCSNGSTVVDAAGRPLLRNAMDADLCREVLSAIGDLKPGWNCFTGPSAYAQLRSTSYMMGRVASRGTGTGLAKAGMLLKRLLGFVAGTTFKPMVSVESVLRHWDQGLEKMGASFADADSCTEAARRLQDLGRVEVIRMGSTELEITAAGTTKGTGTDWLLNHLALGRQDAVAFGDSENDLPLLGHVGCFVAMGNATPEVRAKADEVCGPISEEGVASWLEAFLRP